MTKPNDLCYEEYHTDTKGVKPCVVVWVDSWVMVVEDVQVPDST